MGSAASTAHRTGPSPSQAQTKEEPQQPKPQQPSIPEEISSSQQTPFEDDAKPSEGEGNVTSTMSSNRLKKLALGIPGYKDQQRDYDPTLAKIDVNKTGEVIWAEPKANPAMPEAASRRLVSLNPRAGASGNSLSSSEDSSPMSSVVGLNSHSASYARLTPGRPPPGRPMPQPTAGPPPGIPARPFPRKERDEPDVLMATFTGPRSFHEESRPRPDIIPVLPIGGGGHSGGNSAAQQLPPRRSAPQLVSSQLPGGAASFSGGPSPGPGPVLPVGLMGPTGPPMRPSTAMVPLQQNPPSTAANVPGGAGPPRMGPPPPSTPLGVTGARPVVKETSNVKRNRAQLPENLTHARPTTGDWVNKRYIVNNYILLETLGTGSYGEVRLCKDRTNEKLFAIKIISKDFLKKRKAGKTDETYFEDIKREIAIMKKLLHPNILRLFEVLDDPRVNKIYLVLEYVKMGDLVNILKKRSEMNKDKEKDKEKGDDSFTPLTDLEVWNILRQLIAGIRYLHFQNIVHGDIKPQNLLLGENGILKIADFGISQMLSGAEQKLLDAAGTPAFMAPELCEKKCFSGQLADIWAMGATAFMLRFGHPPFLAKNIIHLFSKICNDPLVFPGPCDPGLRSAMEAMLEKDPAKRITMAALASHPWLRVPPPVTPRTAMVSRASTAVAATRSPPPATPAKGPPTSNPPVNSPPPLTGGRDSNTSNVGNAKEEGGKGVFLFQPPPSYDAEEGAAMQEKIPELDNNDLFMSIGGIRAHTFEEEEVEEEEIDVEDDDFDDDDDDEEAIRHIPPKIRPNLRKPADLGEQQSKAVREDSPSSTPSASVEKAMETQQSSDIMGTNWGADVFQLIEESDEDDDDDEDEDDENDSERRDVVKGTASKAHPAAHLNNTGQSQRSEKTIRSEMSQEEEALRSLRFMKKVRKSAENVKQYTEPKTTSDIMAGVNCSPSLKTPPPPSLTKNGSVRLKNSSRRFSWTSRDDEEECVEVNTDFIDVMDTLAQQPSRHTPMRSFKRSPASGGHANKSVDEPVIDSIDFTAILSRLTVPARNSRIGLGAAFYSEQGLRSTQEDRCILLPNVTQMRALEGHKYRSETEKEDMSYYSIAAIFDGHNGWKSSQYLSHYFAAALCLQDGFLDSKHIEEAITKTYHQMDYQLCEMLDREEDVSGSTAVVAVFDGRRRRLTVGSVGDSLAVLSRNGRAVCLNSMHRLDLVDEKERERVKAAGGTIINHRINGILAISRAFGDLQFKSPLPQDGKIESWEPGLVIVTPQLHTEVVTPMTEFLILATDGLWDILTPQTAVNLVRTRLQTQPDLQYAAKELVKEALARGSVDNVTALVITFDCP
eukprot:gene3691-4038_t